MTNSARGRRPTADRGDRRELRRALGTYATGVTVITTGAPDGRRAGITVNSFTSLSLDPPLVLFCLATRAPSHADFHAAGHFAIHVLAADQHHLSRQFSTPAADKFSCVDVIDGPGGVPLIDGVIARFVCRQVNRYDGGDHSIFVGEVQQYEQFDGDPLVLHSGCYCVAATHPDFSDQL